MELGIRKFVNWQYKVDKVDTDYSIVKSETEK
jgi:hypothetical protein